MTPATILRVFHQHKTALLTTYRSDGTTAVDTPVSFVLDGDRVVFRTWEDSGKAKRLRRRPVADLRPCTFRGSPLGVPVRGDVRLLEGDDAKRAARLLTRHHPMLQGWAVPLSHRVMRYRTLHFELRPIDTHQHAERVESAEGWPD